MPLLQAHVADDIERAGEEVAANLRAKLPDDVPVKVTSFINESGRPVTMVTITHPSGLARQAKDGVVTRAASEAGLDIRRYEIE
nr:hypothetical protein [Corynebacterium lemuris]